MKSIKSFLLGSLFLCMLIFVHSTTSYAVNIKNTDEKITSSYAQENKNANVEKVLNSYFNLEWSSVKDGTAHDSSNIVVNNDFKTYFDKYIQTRVNWYSSINTKIQKYELYVDVTNVSTYNNTYVVNVNLGIDLAFLDSSDILQKMRSEKHIIILDNQDNTLKIRNDFKVDELKEKGYSDLDLATLSSLEKIEKNISDSKIKFITNCLNNVNSEALKYKEQLQTSVKNNSTKSTDNTLSPMGTLSTYNRTNAVNYAVAHVDDEPTYTSDCTNFISNCLSYGGLATSTMWKPGSSAWTSVQLWYDYFVTASNRGTEVSFSTDLGDIVQFGNTSIDWHHSTIITYVRAGTGEVFVTSHTNARLNWAIGNYYATWPKTRFIHIY